MQLSIVVPCYNEADNLVDLIAAFRAVAGEREDIEVIFVNNGSKDQSAGIFAEQLARPQNAFARVVDVVANEGYGHGILSGLRHAKGEYLAWTHADLQTDPADVVEAWKLLTASPDPKMSLVRGRRKGRPLLDRAFTGGMSLFASLALSSRLRDINAQPKVFHRSFFESIEAAAPKDFSLDLYWLYRANVRGLKSIEIPVFFHPRLRGEAKGGGSFKLKYKLTKRTARYIFELRRNLRAAAPPK